MPEGRFGRRLGRCVLVALFGAAFAIAGVSGVYAAVTSGDQGFSTQDFTWGMAGPAAVSDGPSVAAAARVQQLDFTWG